MAPPMVTRTFFSDGRTQSYETPALTPFEMARFALRYMRVVADGTYEKWVADMEEANRFATFCVAETALPDAPDWCDPTRSFSDLWSAFLNANINTNINSEVSK